MLDSNYLEAWNNLGHCKNTIGDYIGAIAAFKRVLQLNPNYQLAINNLADATNKLEIANGRDPKFTREQEGELINKSLEAYQKQDYAMVITYCHEIIAHNPNNCIALNNMGAAYNALQQFDKAFDALQKSLKINPNFELAKNNLKDVESKRKR